MYPLEGTMKRVLIKTANTSVLVVDDNEVNLLVAKATLQQYGINVEAVQSGAEALEKLAASAFDLIILDCIMPEMNGHETAKRIRALNNDRAGIPIVAYTSNNLEDVLKEFADIGVTDALIKPLDTIELTKVLLKYLPDEKLLDKDEVLSELKLLGSGVDQEDEIEHTPFFDALTKVKGLDYATGLHYASDNEDNYRKVVSSACESMKSISENIGLYVKQMTDSRSVDPAFAYDAGKLRVDSHSMKGVCACIGMAEISETSAALEKKVIAEVPPDAFKDELSEYAEKLAEAGHMLQTALDEYNEKTEKQEAEEIVEMPEGEYKSLWKDTEEAVRCFDIDSICVGIKALLRATKDSDMRAALKRAGDAAERFDYGVVSQVLTEYRP